MRRKMSEAGRLYTFNGHGHCPQSGLFTTNIKHEFPNSTSSEIVLLFVEGATHRMTMTYITFMSVLQVLFRACIKESDLTLRKTRGYNESTMNR